jgi:hypothetical protein
MRPWVSKKAFLIVACFSRHASALDWARPPLEAKFGAVARQSPDFDFNQTTYYEATMGAGLLKRFLVFEPFFEPEILPNVKNFTIALENDLAATGQFPEVRPLNLDPGYLQLGKFLLATTKDQSHRIYLRDNIFAEVTLRYQKTGFEPWPWTYADYQVPAVRAFLNDARALLAERIRAEKAPTANNSL